MKYIDAEKLKAYIQYLIKKDNYELFDVPELISFIDSLQQEQSKFNVGDLVVSKKNPHLTYKILATNILNELGKTDYKVEIFTDGKPGILHEAHNIHLISSDKIEDWGELVRQEQPEVDLEKELDQWRHKHFKGKRDDDYNGEYLERESQLDLANHFWNKGVNARKEE